MLSLNRATILGNATRDVEIRYTPNGQAVASFSVATNRRYTTKDGNQQEDTQYHEIVVWAKLAEIAGQIVKRGSRVYVEGRLRTRQWQGQDGNQRQRTEIIAENLIVMTPRGESGQPSMEPSMPAPTPKAPNLDKDEKLEAKDEKEQLDKVEPSSTKEEKTEKDAAPEDSKSPKEKKDKDEEEISLDEIPF